MAIAEDRSVVSSLAPSLTVIPGRRRLRASLDVNLHERAGVLYIGVFGILRATVGGTGNRENRGIRDYGTKSMQRLTVILSLLILDTLQLSRNALPISGKTVIHFFRSTYLRRSGPPSALALLTMFNLTTSFSLVFKLQGRLSMDDR